eukprot:COSAG05_NODE_2287_length_3273_cov_132.259609_3_plen_46_part_00
MSHVVRGPTAQAAAGTAGLVRPRTTRRAQNFRDGEVRAREPEVQG